MVMLRGKGREMAQETKRKTASSKQARKSKLPLEVMPFDALVKLSDRQSRASKGNLKANEAANREITRRLEARGARKMFTQADKERKSGVPGPSSQKRWPGPSRLERYKKVWSGYAGKAAPELQVTRKSRIQSEAQKRAVRLKGRKEIVKTGFRKTEAKKYGTKKR